jgi:3-oxoacyl-[acyl-carrier protein] reductase
MDLQLAKRHCLVTGASAGIGRAVAIQLASEGARVAIAARDARALEALSTEIVAGGGIAPTILTGDLVAPDGPAAIAQAALSALGNIDVLVNNAGGSRPLPPDAGDDAWEESFALNFRSACKLTEALLPGMKAAKWGRIVNITGAIVAKALNAASPAKAALESCRRLSLPTLRHMALPSIVSHQDVSTACRSSIGCIRPKSRAVHSSSATFRPVASASLRRWRR